MFEGTMTALVTPFKNGKIDEPALRKLVDFNIEKGIDGLVPCGSTGESATLSHQEHTEVIKIVVDQAAGRAPVVAGTGSNSTSEAINLTRGAKEAGAVGALMISPYYNKPTQEGLYRHYKAVAEAVDINIILYNIQGRTAVNIEVETVARLSLIPNIVGIKEASGNLEQVSRIIAACPDDFAVLSGDDSLTLPIMSVGGKGVISTTSNVTPELMSMMVKNYDQGKLSEARALHYKLLPLFKGLFVETNPIPVKKALELMGMIGGEIRLPLVPMSEAKIPQLEKTLKDLNLI